MRVRAVKDRTEWRIDLWDDARPLSAHGVRDQTSPWVLIGVDAGVTEQALAVRLDAVDECRSLLEHEVAIELGMKEKSAELVASGAQVYAEE